MVAKRKYQVSIQYLRKGVNDAGTPVRTPQDWSGSVSAENEMEAKQLGREAAKASDAYLVSIESISAVLE